MTLNNKHEDVEYIILLDGRLLHYTGRYYDLSVGGEPYQWMVPPELRKEVENWTVKEGILKTLENYEKKFRQKFNDANLGRFIKSRLDKGLDPPGRYSGHLIKLLLEGKEIMLGGAGPVIEPNGVNSLTVNNKKATLDDKIEKYASYYPDIGNIFKIEMRFVECG